jgi:hypothetical protein
LNTYNRGGGIFNWAAYLTVIRSTITGNEARATRAVDPASGGGGGIANQLGDLIVIESTVSGNEAICDQLWPGDPDLCGRGGGIVNAGGDATIVNSTISANTTALLNSNHSPYLGGGGGGGFAHMPQVAGIYIYCPVSVLDSVTITNNAADHGGGIDTQWEASGSSIYAVPAWAVGDGYECPDLYVRNTIVAGNTATFTAGTEDSWGNYTSEGYNLVGDGTGAPADGPGDVTTLDARLGLLADNGGSTLTHLPLKGSPAIDAGSTDQNVDQRGVARPVGTADDIGAVEAPVYPNEPPVLDVIGDQSVAEGATLDVGITASDADGDPLTFTLSGEPVFATLVDHGDGTATLSLTPGFDDAGVYPGVTVIVSDIVDTDWEMFTITVSDTNRAPTADDQSVTTTQHTPVSITLTGTDPDEDPLTFAIATPPAHGLLSGTSPDFTYTPDSGYSGPDTFTYTASDGDLTSTPATVSVTVELYHIYLPLVLRN